MKRISLILLLLSIPVLMRAQHPSDYNAGGKFPQINADNSVTVQVRAPEAKAITLDLGKRYPMKNDGNGVWTATQLLPDENGEFPKIFYMETLVISEIGKRNRFD